MRKSDTNQADGSLKPKKLSSKENRADLNQVIEACKNREKKECKVMVKVSSNPPTWKLVNAYKR